MLALLLAATVVAQSSFDLAMRAYVDVDLPTAKRLFADAAIHDSDPHRRARAALRLAYIAWHIDRDAAAARKWLDSIDDEETLPSAWTERARLDMGLANDFDAGRADAAHALHAPKPTDSMRAATLHAAASIEPAMRGIAVDRAQLDAAKEELRDAIGASGPFVEAARLQLDAAIVTNDGPTALAAWREYFGATAQSAILTSAEKALANWSDRRGVGLALARSGFFREAATILQTVPKDEAVSDVIAYAKFVDRAKHIADDYYRDVALKRADVNAFRASFDEARQALWNALSWNGKRPQFSSTAFDEEIGRRYNAVVRFGNTANIFVLHYAHKVSDERRTISQFGREAPLQFVVLDGVVSNGFQMWYGPSGGDGGWADTAIYQVRPMYANGPLADWLRAMNPSLRDERERNIVDETARDNDRAAVEPIRFFPGVQLRLERLYDDSVLDALKTKGLAGDQLRDAYIARVERDVMESSIWSHEGRHAIDKKYGHWITSPELEFRAKLSQLQFAPSPLHAIVDIAGSGNPEFGDTPHGKANRRIAQALFDWMKTHAAQINGLDASRPLMLQLDKLTDDQVRAAARAVDPLAK